MERVLVRLHCIVLDESIMLLLPIVRVVVSISEDKSAVRLVPPSACVNTADDAIGSGQFKIGRASCRERV